VGFGAVSPNNPDAAAVKGIRAIVVHGKRLSAPIAVGDTEAATYLYGAIVRGFLTGEPYPYTKLKDRPCLGIAAFILRPNNEFIPAAQLWPDWADFKYWFYPATGKEPAVFMTRRVVSAELLKELASHGIPVRLEPTSQSSCEFEPPKSQK
jgi:hypothetical protein